MSRELRTSRRAPPFLTSATATLALTVTAAPLLLGGAVGWTVPIIASLSGLSALVAVAAAWWSQRALPLSLPLLVLVTGTVWTTLQAVPLPCDVVRRFAPESVVQAERTAAVFDVPVRCTLSQDPGRTREEVLKGLALISAFVAASLLGAAARRDVVLEIVVLAGACSAVATLGHQLLDARAVWGFYEPVHPGALVGPLLNPNHLGGLLALVAPVALGLSMSRRHQERRGAWTVGALLALAGVAATLSRGAILAALGGLGLFGALVARQQARATRSERRSRLERLLLRPVTWVALPIAAGAVVMVGAAGIEALAREAGSGDASKLALIARALELAITGPWMGVGRGAFAAVFAAHADTSQVRFEYAESFPAQWAVDWGIPMAVALFSGLSIAFVRALRTANRPHVFGALAGVAAYATQNLVDFGMEMLGSAVVAAVALAASMSGHTPSDGAEPVAVRRSLGFGLLASLLTMAATALLGPSVHAQRVETARSRLETALSTGNRESFARDVRVAASLHPREPVFPLLAASEAVLRGDLRALTYANRAMQLAPAWSSPRLLAARSLIQAGRFDQALLELREAMERDDVRTAPVACEVVRQRPTAETILRIAPRNDRRPRGLATLATCLPVDAEDADAIDRALLDAEPSLIEPRLRLATRALRRGDMAAALAWTETSGQLESAALLLMRAQVFIADGRAEDALALARRAESISEQPWAAVEVRARAHAAARQLEEMRETVAELRGLAGADATRLGNADILLGELERAAGNRGQALAAYENAWRSFERLDALEFVAALAGELGDERRAATARRILCERERYEHCPQGRP